MNNADRVEFDHGRFEWEDLDPYRRGVFCSFMTEDGQLLWRRDPGDG